MKVGQFIQRTLGSPPKLHPIDHGFARH